MIEKCLHPSKYWYESYKKTMKENGGYTPYLN